MAQTKRHELGEIAMMRRLTALITTKIQTQKGEASTNQKCAPMIALEPGLLRSIAGGDGVQSPKGSW
jgi:hypothetical protein